MLSAASALKASSASAVTEVQYIYDYGPCLPSGLQIQRLYLLVPRLGVPRVLLLVLVNTKFGGARLAPPPTCAAFVSTPS